MTLHASQNAKDIQSLADTDAILEEQMNLTKSALEVVQFDLALAQKDLTAVTEMVKVTIICQFLFPLLQCSCLLISGERERKPSVTPGC